ncbi:hypothetical protein BH23THE1_BH23THE1_36390 [soil metagenome]
MNLEKLVAVTGMQGLYKVAGTRTNGLIIEDMDTGKRKFAPMRVHQFSPLESIAIFTYDDAEPLKNVFSTMFLKMEVLVPPSPNDANPVLEKYFREILPSYDEDQVKISDIKKLIKWFTFLHAKGLFQEVSAANSEEE